MRRVGERGNCLLRGRGTYGSSWRLLRGELIIVYSVRLPLVGYPEYGAMQGARGELTGQSGGSAWASSSTTETVCRDGAADILWAAMQKGSTNQNKLELIS